MRYLSSLLSFLLCLLLASCGGESPRLMLASLENAQSEALLRHLYETCPVKAEVTAATLMLTAQQLEPTDAFRERLANLGPRMLKHKELSAVRLADVTRIVEKTHGANGRALVLLLQVTQLTASPDKSFTAVGAWAYKDSLQRQEFRIVPAADGKFTIEPGTVLEKKPQ